MDNAITYHRRNLRGDSQPGRTYVRVGGLDAGYYERRYGVSAGYFGAYGLRLFLPRVPGTTGNGPNYDSAGSCRHAIQDRVAALVAQGFDVGARLTVRALIPAADAPT